MNKNKLSGFATRAIHVGQEPDLESGAVSAPIYPTSTYVQQEIGKNKGYEYARVSNPTRTRLEKNLAALEGGISSRVFASGMAAITALCTMTSRATTSSAAIISTEERHVSSTRFSPATVSSSLTWTLPMSEMWSAPFARRRGWFM
jgi:cystathionine beta-lyase/cystathionine gamma-synthase